MGDRKRAPVLAHLLAATMGMSLDPELAKDFWFGREEPWNPEHEVQSRFLKLAYMYVASAVAQVGIPLFLLAIIFEIVRTPKNASFQFPFFAMYVMSGLTLVAVLAGLLMAALEWRKIMKQRRSHTDR